MLREPAPEIGTRLSGQEEASIDLAVSQWLRSGAETSRARERLRALGVSEGEIEARRRCTSDDLRLQTILRFAVTCVMTRGRLEARDSVSIERAGGGQLARAVVTAATRAVAKVAATRRLGTDKTHPPIDMEVGDY